MTLNLSKTNHFCCGKREIYGTSSCKFSYLRDMHTYCFYIHPCSDNACSPAPLKYNLQLPSLGGISLFFMESRRFSSKINFSMQGLNSDLVNIYKLIKTIIYTTDNSQYITGRTTSSVYIRYGTRTVVPT